MPTRNEFVEHLVALLEPLGGVRARAMFGGYGVYRNDLMFGLVSDDADEMCRWAAKSYEVAVRTAKPKFAKTRTAKRT